MPRSEPQAVDGVARALLAGLLALHDADDLAVFADALPRVLADVVPFDACALVGDLAGPGSVPTPAPGAYSLTLRTPAGGSTLRGVVLGRDHPFTPMETALAAAAAPHLGSAADHVRLRQRDRALAEQPASALLTRREREVLAFVAEGRTDRDIAHLLHIESRTVEKHVEHIRAKLGARSRAEAVARWARWSAPIYTAVVRPL